MVGCKAQNLHLIFQRVYPILFQDAIPYIRNLIKTPYSNIFMELISHFSIYIYHIKVSRHLLFPAVLSAFIINVVDQW